MGIQVSFEDFLACGKVIYGLAYTKVLQKEKE